MHPALPEGFSDLRRNPSVSNANGSRVAVVGRMAPFCSEAPGKSSVDRWCPMVNKDGGCIYTYLYISIYISKYLNL